MDELTARRKITQLLEGDVLDGTIGSDVSIVVDDHIAAIRTRSGGAWDKRVAAEYVLDLEKSLAAEAQDLLEEESYDDER